MCSACEDKLGHAGSAVVWQDACRSQSDHHREARDDEESELKRIRGPFEFVEWMLDVAIFTRQATVVEPRARSGWRWRIVDQLPVAGMDQLTINQLIEWYGTFSLGLDMPEESDEHAKLGCPAAKTEFPVKPFTHVSRRSRRGGEKKAKDIWQHARGCR